MAGIGVDPGPVEAAAGVGLGLMLSQRMTVDGRIGTGLQGLLCLRHGGRWWTVAQQMALVGHL